MSRPVEDFGFLSGDSADIILNLGIIAISELSGSFKYLL